MKHEPNAFSVLKEDKSWDQWYCSKHAQA